jgi:hypothetical protein
MEGALGRTISPHRAYDADQDGQKSHTDNDGKCAAHHVRLASLARHVNGGGVVGPRLLTSGRSDGTINDIVTTVALINLLLT